MVEKSLLSGTFLHDLVVNVSKKKKRGHNHISIPRTGFEPEIIRPKSPTRLHTPYTARPLSALITVTPCQRQLLYRLLWNR